jgi:hypothetical protein
MTVSELIAKLQEILETEGDLPVECPPWDGESDHVDLRQVFVFGKIPGSNDRRRVNLGT